MGAEGLWSLAPGAPPYCRMYTGGSTELHEIARPEILDAGGTVLEFNFLE